MSFGPSYFQADVFWDHNMTFFYQAPEYFLREACGKCSFSVLLSLSLNLGHVRMYDVGELTGKVTGLFLLLKPVGEKKRNDSPCANSYRLLERLSLWQLGERIQLITFQKSPKPCLYCNWFNNSSECTFGQAGIGVFRIILHTLPRRRTGWNLLMLLE